MDFDEYEYLEKMVDNPEPLKVKDAAGEGDETAKFGEKNRSRSSKHKLDDRDRVEHRSKSSKSEGELRSHDRGRERSSLRHRSPTRDKDKDRHKNSQDHRDTEERYRDKEMNGMERDRDRDRERDRDRDSDRDRDKGKREYENENKRQRERDKSHRSRNQSEKHQSDHDEKDGERSQDKDSKEREKEREPKERFRESRRHREKKEDGTEPEADPERDQRTVFAYQICLKANERDVYDFFTRAGKVRDVRLIMDRNSRRSKGFGYIEFYDAMSVPMAIALSGQILLSQPVMVKPSEAEKNQAHSAAAAAGSGGLTGPYSGGARRLYVGNLHTSITEDNLRQVFGAFGSVELVQLPVDETGHCKGFGFIQFARLEDARNALSLNGQLDIAGRTIKVSAVTDQVGSQDLEKNTGDFDDDEGGNLSLDARSRALLMLKLDRSGTASSITGSIPAGNSSAFSLPISPIVGTAPMMSSIASLPALAGLSNVDFQFPATTIPAIDTIGVPSNCLLLKNMFDPSVETEPDFDLDIKDDVKDECSKFGNIKHIDVDKNTAGFVYLKFEHTQSAIDAQRSLHGRWFAGKMITATFMVPQMYDLKFPEKK